MHHSYSAHLAFSSLPSFPHLLAIRFRRWTIVYIDTDTCSRLRPNSMEHISNPSLGIAGVMIGVEILTPDLYLASPQTRCKWSRDPRTSVTSNYEAYALCFHASYVTLCKRGGCTQTTLFNRHHKSYNARRTKKSSSTTR